MSSGSCGPSIKRSSSKSALPGKPKIQKVKQYTIRPADSSAKTADVVIESTDTTGAGIRSYIPNHSKPLDWTGLSVLQTRCYQPDRKTPKKKPAGKPVFLPQLNKDLAGKAARGNARAGSGRDAPEKDKFEKERERGSFFRLFDAELRRAT